MWEFGILIDHVLGRRTDQKVEKNVIGIESESVYRTK
jgi:hypothetical protein